MHGCEVLDCSDIKGTNCYCEDAAKEQILKRIEKTGVAPRGIRFWGSGNYHYISYLTTSLIRESYTLVMIDHHPDLRAPAFGDLLSCGGWVREVFLKQPLCKKIVLIDVAEDLFREEYEALLNEWEGLPGKDGMLPPGERICLYSVKEAGTDLHDDLDRLLPQGIPVFLSVDLDVLSEEEVVTNWDQGEMSLQTLLHLLRTVCRRRPVIGMDICGDA